MMDEGFIVAFGSFAFAASALMLHLSPEAAEVFGDARVFALCAAIGVAILALFQIIDWIGGGEVSEE